MFVVLALVMGIQAISAEHQGSPLSANGERAVAKGPTLSPTQVTFLSKLFPLVGEPTIHRRYASSLKTAALGQPVDESSIASDMGELMITVDGDEGLKSLIEAVETERTREVDSGVEKESYDKTWVTILDRISWAAKRIQGTIVTTEDGSKGFTDNFLNQYREELKRSELVREAVRDGNVAFLRDPKHVDHGALTQFLIHSRDRKFASDLADKFMFDKSLQLMTAAGESISLTLGLSPGEALSALSRLPEAEGARISTTKAEPSKRLAFNGTTWTPLVQPKVDLSTQVAAILEKRCTGCHHEPADLLSWRGSTIVARVTSADPKVRMPRDLAEQGKFLPPNEIEILKRWAGLSPGGSLARR